MVQVDDLFANQPLGTEIKWSTQRPMSLSPFRVRIDDLLLTYRTNMDGDYAEKTWSKFKYRIGLVAHSGGWNGETVILKDITKTWGVPLGFITVGNIPYSGAYSILTRPVAAYDSNGAAIGLINGAMPATKAQFDIAWG